MNISDPIADMLARIRNAANANLEVTQMPLSKTKKRIAAILKEEGYISDFGIASDSKPTGHLNITMKYGQDQEPAIAGMRRTSRPGRRVYVSYKDIPSVLNGMGTAIVSTSKGIMTGTAARTAKVGGEVLCEIW